MDFAVYKKEINNSGFTVLNNIYTKKETEDIAAIINTTNITGDTFRKSKDLFAIRQFLKEIPYVQSLVFNDNLKTIISTLFGKDYFSIKSIYFNKPGNSNWFVAYHQDLTISVDKKTEIENFGPWTVKQNQFAVQPPIEILENIFTIRIHLDDTDENNGALKVIPESHLKKIYRPETIDWSTEKEVICNVDKGGVMIMKPLLLHSSARTVNNNNRRVIHIEFSNMELPSEIKWAEKLEVN
ncbi:phytanoyl-CoA dioxygenase family protein [Flavobacterium beibuense]|uniref:Protein involved in biosynthesis of mitomycin antibiotics/polyketide fumonisin n=1 Tax=Flavobacterium beibuense TaxID=657326 RepID=A0A444WGA3_9FLAO|nr:phytanoyl-CoA dioxygenase family protein [Flavobacterium beibuense]RYJ44870.1 Protein involved in biosynthesis of mitomycin antibiotics/polyketide fumonisin [Flavobacterium beibuense]